MALVLVPLFCFVSLIGFGFQLFSSLGWAFLLIVLLTFYYRLNYHTVCFYAGYLEVRNKLLTSRIAFKDIVSMSFGGNFFGMNSYYLRLKNGGLMRVPLIDDFSEFEHCMEKNAELILEGESVSNFFEFRIMTPKNRRWTRKNHAYQHTTVLDRLDPTYVPLDRALLTLFFVGFVFGMLALFFGIMSSN